MKKLLKFIGITVCVILFLQYRLYSSEALEGFVYDTETNQPLEGVEVEICWILHYGIVLHMTSTINSFKTRTDKNGYFYFPAWGPKIDKRREISKGPILSLYKESYERKSFDHYQYYYGFLVPWVVIGDPPWYNNRGEKTIRLKRPEPNTKK